VQRLLAAMSSSALRASCCDFILFYFILLRTCFARLLASMSSSALRAAVIFFIFFTHLLCEVCVALARFCELLFDCFDPQDTRGALKKNMGKNFWLY
jgi:hypothetical protein